MMHCVNGKIMISYTIDLLKKLLPLKLDQIFEVYDKVLAIGKMLIVILRHFSFYFSVMICEEVDQKLLATGQITMFWVDAHPFKWP